MDYKQHINITYTLLCREDTKIEELEKLSKTFRKKILEQYEEKKYKVVKMTIGIHQNASRNHIHIGHVLYIGDKKLAHWDKHLRTHILLLDNSIKEKIDIKISYKDNIEELDVHNVLAYPLKEYKTDLEIRYIEQFIGLEQKEINHLRDYAHQIYLTKLYDNKTKEDKKIIEEENSDSKYKYLDNELEISDLLRKIHFREKQPEQKLKQVLGLLLKYEKLQHLEKNKKVFRTNCLLDITISYLYFRELISEDEIISYKFRI